MKPKNIFGVAVRIVGLIAIMVGIYNLVSGGILLLVTGMRGNAIIWALPITAIVLIILGLYLLRGAPLVTRFAYPKDDSDDDQKLDA